MKKTMVAAFVFALFGFACSEGVDRTANDVTTAAAGVDTSQMRTRGGVAPTLVADEQSGDLICADCCGGANDFDCYPGQSPTGGPFGGGSTGGGGLTWGEPWPTDNQPCYPPKGIYCKIVANHWVCHCSEAPVDTVPNRP